MIDSTTWISALHFGGAPRQALDSATTQFTLISSAYIRSEVERNLALKFGWNVPRVRLEMHRYLGDGPDVIPSSGVHDVCRDAKDDLVLDCAITVGAELIISGDRDLLVLHPYAGIAILTPRQFLDIYQ